MKKVLVVAIIQVIMIFTFSTVSMADGNDLLLQCQDLINYIDTGKIRNELDVGLCLGMIEGVRYTMMFYNDEAKDYLKACWPEKGINNGQSARIVVAYLKKHPEYLHQDNFFLTIKAYVNAYPCK